MTREDADYIGFRVEHWVSEVADFLEVIETEIFPER